METDFTPIVHPDPVRVTMRCTKIEEDSMIAVGDTAPDFKLKDQFGRDITLEQFKGRRHVMLLFYPLDFTPT
jgi:peroxiredoxin